MHNGPLAKPIPIGQPIPLVASDLERLKKPRFVPQSPQTIRDSHHMIARLAAAGLRHDDIAQRTGYSRIRVQSLLASPAMDELVAQYRKKIDEAFVENIDAFFSLATQNMIAAERHIADQIAELDEKGELLPVRTALAISRDAADRFGYGKKTQNLNINVDFAAQLERAIARSGKTLEGNATEVASTTQHEARSIPSRSPRPTSTEPAIHRQLEAASSRTMPSNTRSLGTQSPLLRRRA